MHREHLASAVAPEVEAAWLHHRFTQIHPFQDGNGRIARALASLVFIRAGWFPLVVTRDDRERYVSALEAADAGDLVPLVTIFTSLQRRWFVNALGIAREVLQEGERVEQLIASVRDMFAKRDDALQQQWNNAKIIADDLFGMAESRLKDVAVQLTEQIAGFSSQFSFFTVAEFDGGDRKNWYRWQTIEVARQLDYFANTRDYSAWVRLGLRTDSPADLVVAFTAIGRDFRGLIGVSAFFFRREETEASESQFVDVTPVAEELFQINYKEERDSVSDRFGRWLDRALVRGIEVWRQGL
jgi:hypothetical protein